MGSSNNKHTLSTAEGFRQVLCHLHDEAVAAGWAVPAHFIDVAAEAMQTHIFESNTDPANGIPVRLIVPATAPAQTNDDRPK